MLALIVIGVLMIFIALIIRIIHIRKELGEKYFIIWSIRRGFLIITTVIVVMCIISIILDGISFRVLLLPLIITLPIEGSNIIVTENKIFTLKKELTKKSIDKIFIYEDDDNFDVFTKLKGNNEKNLLVTLSINEKNKLIEAFKEYNYI